jgi:hypothetical protein
MYMLFPGHEPTQKQAGDENGGDGSLTEYEKMVCIARRCQNRDEIPLPKPIWLKNP